MAGGIRTQGPSRANPGAFSGLAQIILASGEASARRTERQGEILGGALSDLGQTLLGKKERAAARAERQEERQYQRGRDATEDSRWAQTFAAQQEERLHDRDRQAVQDQLAAANSLRDDQRADLSLDMHRQAADQQAEDGKISLLNLLADNYRQQANEAAALGDQAAAQAALENAQRAQRGIESVAARRGIGLGPEAVQRPGAAPMAQSAESDFTPSVSADPAVDPVAFRQMLMDEKNRTDASIAKIKDPVERERQRKIQQRALAVFDGQFKGLAVAESQRKKAKERDDALAFGEGLLRDGFSREEVASALQRRRGGQSEESISARLDTQRERQQAQAPKNESPQAAADAIRKIIQDAQAEDQKIQAAYRGFEKPDDVSKQNEHAAIRRRMVEDLGRQPDALAKAFPLSDTATQALLLEAVGGSPAEAAVKVAADWRRLNPNAPPEDAARIKAMLKAAVAARQQPAQGR